MAESTTSAAAAAPQKEESDANTSIYLVASDGASEVKFTKAEYSQSVTIKNMLEDILITAEGGSDDKNIPRVPVPTVNIDVLERVHTFCSQVVAGNVDDAWKKEFFNVPVPTLLNIMKASDYLDIVNLTDSAATAIAMLIHGRTPDEIRKIFGIKCDFTEEEKAKLAKEMEWCDAAMDEK